MVTPDSVDKQLKKLKFNLHGWGRGEVRELPNIILPDEEIYELVNGIYEGGFALLIASNIRVLLIDKKPLNFLTVEDLRFDMINEIDYNHRLLGAYISISAGAKNLKFRSYNQQRLRKLITHVQHCMADSKKQQSNHQEDQNQHLEQINQQLQAYLLATHKQQMDFQEQLQNSNTERDTSKVIDGQLVEPVKPSPELNDYLFAQSLLAQRQDQTQTNGAAAFQAEKHPVPPPQPAAPKIVGTSASTQMADLYAEGMQEIFGNRAPQKQHSAAAPATAVSQPQSSGPDQRAAPEHEHPLLAFNYKPLEINALKIAYSKLPMALRNRRFGRPSFHSHSKSTPNRTRPTRISTAKT